MTTFTPATAAETLATVAWAAAEETPLEILGHGSKRGIGRPLQTEHTLDLSKLSGVTLYEPAELVLSAKAGTPLAEIETLLAENGQQLAFEPMDYGALLGGEKGKGTIGGVLAANLCGPRRLKAGSARDHILGIAAVSGSWRGVQVGRPRGQERHRLRPVQAHGQQLGHACRPHRRHFQGAARCRDRSHARCARPARRSAAAAMALALGSSAEVSSAAHLPERVAARVAGGQSRQHAATLLRVEGFGPSVAYRIAALKDLLGNAGPLEEISGETSHSVWRDIRDCAPFADGTEKPVWRVSMAPAQGHQMVLALRMQAAVDAFYDWQGGLIWLRMEHGDPEADLLRALVRKYGGGHATLVRAAPSHRAAVPVFEPQAPQLAALSARLKAEFDPKAILNPGRMA